MIKQRFIITFIIVFAIMLTACSSSNDAQNDNFNDTTNNEKNEIISNNNADEKPTSETNNDDTIDEQLTIIDQLPDQSIAVLVNKQYSLGEDYVPDDLVTVDVPTVLENPEVKQLREVAAEALFNMFAEAKQADVYLHARSGYRSYETQVQLFNNYKAKHGEKAANRYSAKPGHSEHQTGLVMDITSESVNFQLTENFGTTKEGIWVKENAHKFGFIIRYPEDKEEITGYIYEPWHLRYLGVQLATAVYESGLTYEQYLTEEGLVNEVIAKPADEAK